MLNYCFCFSVE